uniref:Pectin lyase-like superfamily protein n=2 Tax=Zea mays TaxID=4577 RepID=A0A804PTG6_MAIZE
MAPRTLGLNAAPLLQILRSLCLLALAAAAAVSGRRHGASPARGSGQSMYLAPACRAHTASVADFGGVGDGTTSNTAAFRSAVDHLSQYSGEGGGGGMLYVPAGKWLTGPFNLTSHFTLYLHQDAVILGSQDVGEWPIVDPLPSYGRGRDKVGGRFASLIGGSNLTDVVITGSNGTIDGQGAMWWSKFHKNQLKYTRGYLQPDAAQLAGVEHPPSLQQQHRGARHHHPGADQLAQHRRHQPRLLLSRPHRGLLHRVGRRLRGHQERLGRVRHLVRDAQPAHRHPPPHVRVPDQRRHRAGQRDVGRHPGRARRGHHGDQHRVRRAHQDRRRPRRLRQGRVRAPDDAHHHEAGVLDDGRLQVPPGRQVRPQRRPRCRQHQLPGRGGHGGLQGGGAPPGHPGRTVPGHLRRQRHRRPVQVQEVPMELRRHRGSVGQRQPRAVRPATGRARRRMPVPDRHAAHRPGHSAAVRIRHPGHQLAAQSRSVFGCGSAA